MVVLYARLLDMKPIDINMTVPVEKPFNISLTFENPTIKTLNLTDLSAECYTWGPFGSPSMLATSDTVKPVSLDPGRTRIILTERPTVNDEVSSAVGYYWDVYYSLRLGSVNYQFVVVISDSSITQQGTYSLGENQVYSLIRTYTLLTADAWAFALITMALFELAQERRVGLGLRWNVPRKEHNKMLAVNYAVQGMGIIVALFLPPLMNFILSEPPLGPGPSLQGSADAILWGFSFIFAVILFALAMSFLTRPLDAKTYGLFISFIGSPAWFIGGVSVLTHLASIQDVALASLLLAAAMGNVIAVFILLRMKQT